MLLEDAPLAQITAYPSHYDPTLLFPIPRIDGRDQQDFPFFGVDIWNAYELSYLNLQGKPVIALARFTFPSTSSHLIESKSFKLYLNSFNQERLESNDTLASRLEADLSKACGAPCTVELSLPQQEPVTVFFGHCIDKEKVCIEHYHVTPSLLRTLPNTTIKETLYSQLFKSNCPKTGQPDWADIQISYEGAQIDHSSLLAYFISYRNHAGFHEQCVERVFKDLWSFCKPQSLTVFACYTRRGGLDINPFRSSEANSKPSYKRLVRQ